LLWFLLKWWDKKWDKILLSGNYLNYFNEIKENDGAPAARNFEPILGRTGGLGTSITKV